MASKVVNDDEKNELQRKLFDEQPQKASTKKQTPCWLAAELRLDDFSIKSQAFKITGWINVFWIWQNAPQKLQNWNGDDDYKYEDKMSKMIIYKNSKDQEIIKITDLQHSNIAYYLPINAKKIFFQPSLLNIEHIDPPSLYYNKLNKLAHTQYYISASLLEHLELFLFPFDRQFLNIKLRWNVDYYRILDFEEEKNIPIDQKWWREREQTLYATPLRISLEESIRNEVKMSPAWVDFREKKCAQKGVKRPANLRFALIRLRVRRDSMYFVSNIIFPFFIIVSCSFSVFAIDLNNIGDRLSVSVTILLTFTAFQTIIAEELPHTSAILFIDWYIGIAYLLQALLILGSCIMLYIDHQDIEFIDKVFALILGLFWVLFSLFYVSLRRQSFRNCYDRMCCLCKVNYNDWEKRGNHEIECWADNDQIVSYDKIVREKKPDKSL